MLAISQCLAVIVGSAFLAVMLRTQLNVLAGALYQQVHYNCVIYYVLDLYEILRTEVPNVNIFYHCWQ